MSPLSPLMRTISKARKDGNSLVITIPSNLIEILSISEGDFLDWECHSTTKN